MRRRKGRGEIRKERRKRRRKIRRKRRRKEEKKEGENREGKREGKREEREGGKRRKEIGEIKTKKVKEDRAGERALCLSWLFFTFISFFSVFL